MRYAVIVLSLLLAASLAFIYRLHQVAKANEREAFSNLFLAIECGEEVEELQAELELVEATALEQRDQAFAALQACRGN